MTSIDMTHEERFKIKFLLAAFFSATAILVFWLFIASPLMKANDKLKRDFAHIRSLLAILIQKEGRFAELENLNREVEQKFPAMARTVLAEKDLLEFVVLLENLARSSGLVLAVDHLPSSAAVPAQKSFKTLSFRLNLWGNFPNFYRFFWSLENLDFWVNVDGVKMSKLDEFALPVGQKFTGLALNDILAIINLTVFLND